MRIRSGAELKVEADHDDTELVLEDGADLSAAPVLTRAVTLRAGTLHGATVAPPELRGPVMLWGLVIDCRQGVMRTSSAGVRVRRCRLLAPAGGPLVEFAKTAMASFEECACVKPDGTTERWHFVVTPKAAGSA